MCSIYSPQEAAVCGNTQYFLLERISQAILWQKIQYKSEYKCAAYDNPQTANVIHLRQSLILHLKLWVTWQQVIATLFNISFSCWWQTVVAMYQINIQITAVLNWQG